MNSNDYITIKEYADIRGCSTSAVYKRLSTTLQPFVIVENGKKYLKREVLQMEGVVNPSHEVSTNPSSTPLQPSTEKGNEEQIKDNESKIIELLEKQIEDLKEQLKKQEDKSKEEIEFLREQIKIKDIQIDQQQKLNAMSLGNEKILTEPKESNIIEENKKGFLKRLFNK